MILSSGPHGVLLGPEEMKPDKVLCTTNEIIVSTHTHTHILTHTGYKRAPQAVAAIYAREYEEEEGGENGGGGGEKKRKDKATVAPKSMLYKKCLPPGWQNSYLSTLTCCFFALQLHF